MSKQDKLFIGAMLFVMLVVSAIMLANGVVTDPGDMCGDSSMSLPARFLVCVVEGR